MLDETYEKYLKDSFNDYKSMFDRTNEYRHFWNWDESWDDQLWEAIYGLAYSGIVFRFERFPWATLRRGKVKIEINNRDTNQWVRLMTLWQTTDEIGQVIIQRKATYLIIDIKKLQKNFKARMERIKAEREQLDNPA